MDAGARRQTTTLRLQIISRVESSRVERGGGGGGLLSGGRRKEGSREAQAAGRGPNSDLIHSRLQQCCLSLSLSYWISSP